MVVSITLLMASYLILLPFSPPFHRTKIIAVLVIKSLQNLKLMVPSCVNGLPCKVCEFSNHHHVSFSPRAESRVSSPFHLVHSDILGPFMFHHALVFSISLFFLLIICISE